MASYPEMDSPCVHFLGMDHAQTNETAKKLLMADEISSSSSSATLSIVQTFRSELRSGFDREDLNENSSLLSYLKFALDSILKQEPLHLL